LDRIAIFVAILVRNIAVEFPKSDLPHTIEVEFWAYADPSRRGREFMIGMARVHTSRTRSKLDYSVSQRQLFAVG
jgi:hypothetical protein